MSKILLIVIFLVTVESYAVKPLNFSSNSSDYFHPDSIVKPEKKHSPKLATIFSMALPGLGQAYNKKYWKIPIVYAALGISGWYILENKTQMSGRQNALKAMLDSDSSTIPDAKYANTPSDVLKAERNLYRTNRDYSIIFFAGFYIINIIDAAVDAHFYKFNIDRPLAQQKKKNWNIYSSRIGNTPAVGLRIRF